jgi:uncharacterized protein YfaS (alpha-2-macroglobulin family)
MEQRALKQPKSHGGTMSNRKGIFIALISLLIASLACSVPVIENIFKSDATPTSTTEISDIIPGLTSTPLPPIPPTLIEVEPAIGVELKTDAPITLFFDQPMDASSVETALQMDPVVSTDMTWLDDSTLEISPLEPLDLATKYTLTIQKEAKSALGLQLNNPIQLPFNSSGYLEVAQVIPQDDSTDINPSSAITVVFNRPVVPLELEGNTVHPLTILPAVQGEGEWISTSIYRFQPEEAFPGGTYIRVRIGTELEDMGGGHLASDYAWSFSTSLPEILSLDPIPGEDDVLLNQDFRITFNQSMDPLQTQQAFSLATEDGEPVPGSFEWEENETVLIFQPSIFLEYDQRYALTITKDAKNPQGTPLTQEWFYFVRTIEPPRVVATSPQQNGVKVYNKLLSISFSTPMDKASILEAITITPSVENMGGFWRESSKEWVVHADFEPATSYQLTLDDSAEDVIGTRIPEPYVLRFSTADMPPLLGFPRYNEVLTLTTLRDQKVDIQVRNLTRLDLSLYQLSLDQFFSLLRSSSYSYPEPTPVGDLLQQWSYPVSTAKNVTEILKVPLEPGDLASGPYMLIVDSPNDPDRAIVRLLVIRDVELVIKATVENALIWAVDLSDGQSVPNDQIKLYAHDGMELGRGQTNEDGILELDFPAQQDPYDRIFAVTGTPGGPGFGFTASTWADGISSYEFGIWMDPNLKQAKAYLYTDRPIYRPGHTVHFRGMLRDIQDDQYQLPEETTILVELLDYAGATINSQMTTISTYGTFQGSFELSPEAEIGEYQLSTEFGSVYFDVAAYRKPDFIVSIVPSAEDVAQGDPLTVEISADYLFGGVVKDARVTWLAYTNPTSPIGIPQAINWFSRAVFNYPIYHFETHASGEGTTDSQGRLTIEIPTTIDDIRPHKMTIEVTVTDVSGLPVSETGSLILHPATVYLTLDPDRYCLREDETALVRLLALDWDGGTIPGQIAQIDVERITWTQVVNDRGRLTYESQATLVNQAILTTAEDGTVLFSFEPQTSGTYKVRAFSKDPAGRDVQTDLTLWVSGQQSRIWRRPSADRIVLVPDKESYLPGETANIFIPSPFENPVEALITIERRGVISHEFITVEGDNTILSLPITEEHLPNIFVSAVLIQPASAGKPEAIAIGLVELDVNPTSKQLNVQLLSNPTIAEPRGTVTYDLLVTDSSGNPVQAEFSFALVDLAVLSLTDPNSRSPIDALYANQTLGVRTGASISLKADGVEPADSQDGVGGGGGGMLGMEIRTDFPDTAYWNPSVLTDAEGRARISLTLPDSLTTWRLDVRGITTDTNVGSAILDVVSTKELLIRPITPRFFTAGDAASVAAILHNNSDQALSVEARISASGAEITDPLTQRTMIPAGGQERVEWNLTIQDVDGVDLTFFASGGDLTDSTKPTIGTTQDGLLPVLQYRVPDTVATAGELVDSTTIIEAVNLPRRYIPIQGDLRVTLDTSLGASILYALEVLEHSPYDTSEQLISRFLPNLYTYLAFQASGISDPALESRLEHSLEDMLQILIQRQNWDGGWGWWRDSSSDIYLTAYSLFALSRAELAGVEINETVLENAIEFLRAGLVYPDLTIKSDFLDRQCFVLYALALVEEGDLPITSMMASRYEVLSTWAQALLASTLALRDPSAIELPSLITELESDAIRSATGTHWQEQHINYWNLESNAKTTAQVLMALLDANPSSSTIPGAVRWLLASRNQDRIWRSSHETAWVLTALASWLHENKSLESDYQFALLLNGRMLTSGTASEDSLLSSIDVTTPISDLYPDLPNQVTFQRTAGNGSLFYTAHLTVFRMIEDVEATSRGLTVYREYFTYDGECGVTESPCPKATSANVGEDLLVRVTLIVPSDHYHIVLEDPFPAGMEPIESRLHPIALDQVSLDESLHMEDVRTWGWWYFSHVELGDDRLTLHADYLPAGTYQYTYQIHALLPGEYRILPTYAWAKYFPEIYGHSAGQVFSIRP